MSNFIKCCTSCGSALTLDKFEKVGKCHRNICKICRAAKRRSVRCNALIAKHYEKSAFSETHNEYVDDLIKKADKQTVCQTVCPDEINSLKEQITQLNTKVDELLVLVKQLVKPQTNLFVPEIGEFLKFGLMSGEGEQKNIVAPYDPTIDPNSNYDGSDDDSWNFDGSEND